LEKIVGFPLSRFENPFSAPRDPYPGFFRGLLKWGRTPLWTPIPLKPLLKKIKVVPV